MSETQTQERNVVEEIRLPSNREVKVSRRKPAFGMHEIPKIKRRPRPDPFYVRFRRLRRRNSAKRLDHFADNDDLRELIEEIDRQIRLEEDRRLTDYLLEEEERDAYIEEYLEKTSYLDWWEERMSPTRIYDENVPCDCPFCTGEEIYDELFDAFDDFDPSFGLEDDTVETELEAASAREPMHRGDERPANGSKRPGKRELRKARARRRNRLAPAKRFWAS